MLDLIFITGNQKKLDQAREKIQGYPINLIGTKLETPEIQDTNVEIIAGYSAQYAANKLGKPVVKTDAGYYIEALNGFPGPFIKYINQWLTPQELIKMMEGKENRRVRSPICVAYCEPGGEPKTFLSENYGNLAFKAEGVNGSTIDMLYIPDGYKTPLATLPEDIRLSLWNADCWVNLAKYLTNGRAV